MAFTSQKINWKTALSKTHLIIALVVLILDQVTKFAVIKWIEFGDRYDIIPDLVSLIHTKNRGAAFGIFHDSSPLFRLVFFGAVTVVCIYLLLYWLGTTPIAQKWQRIALSLILGGAVGNLIDRAFFGEVTDFVDVYYQDHHFPAFNIADSGISIGVVMIFMHLIFWKSKRG